MDSRRRRGAGVTDFAEAPTARTPGGPVSLEPSLVVVSDPSGPAAEAVRALRTHIMAQHVQRGRRALAVCAASVGEGCTFIAANLALALAQIGVNTVLIDGDLRAAGLNRMLRRLGPGPGLADFLSSPDVGFDDVITSEVQPHLSVIFAGGRSSRPQELLGGDRFEEFMSFCLREFEATIVDTPPANACADARRISTVAGYSLIVTRRHQTYVDDVKTLSGQLRADHAQIVGAVMNEA
jgi:capsular exopolysaccharide synthesis family protein